MPKSKRDVTISLTKAKKKGRGTKEKLIREIRESIGQHKTVFLFSVENMRNSKLKDLRLEFRSDSRFFLGKTKVMAIALGRIKEEEVENGLHKLGRRLRGETGILVTNRSEKDVLAYFNSFSDDDFARSGNIATETVELPAGPLPQFAFSIEPQLRKIGMPTELKKGVVTLMSDFTVCNEGDTLNPDQCRILKLLGEKQATFRINMVCCWSKSSGKVKMFQNDDEKTPAAVAKPEMDTD